MTKVSVSREASFDRALQALTNANISYSANDWQGCVGALRLAFMEMAPYLEEEEIKLHTNEMRIYETIASKLLQNDPRYRVAESSVELFSRFELTLRRTLVRLQEGEEKEWK